MKKNRIIILIIVIILSFIVRFFINDTTLFVNTDYKEKGYLPINDYVLKDGDKDVKKINTIYYDFYSTSYNYNDYVTTLGINCESTFKEFVNAYGNYYAAHIHAYRCNDDTYTDNVSINWITIDDFYNEYIKSGKLNLDDYNIDVTFNCMTIFNKVYYDKTAINNRYANEGLIRFSNHLFSLSFSYECKNDEYNDKDFGHFDYISSSSYYS